MCRKVLHNIKQLIGNVLSFPLRIYLALYNPSMNELIHKRNSSKLYFNRDAYNSFIYKIADIPLTVRMGDGIIWVHNSYGTVIHPYTTIGDRVKIYQDVTIGRGNIWEDMNHLEGFEIKKDAVICAGAKIICSKGKLTVGEGTIIGANAVLTSSTEDYEIWAGIPAVKIGTRKH